MSPRTAAAGLVAALLVALAPRPAAAVYQCGPQTDDCQCGANNPYPCCDNGGNCTWWAWEGACCSFGVGLPSWGNANQWAGNAAANPDYLVLGAPIAGSVACRASGDYGHVAWVMSVNGGQIHVSEQNCWGGWGMGERDYDASYFDGGFIVPRSKCECTPGQTQSDGCGRCGTRTRGCDGCTWGGFGACEGEGVCDPGQSDQQACGDCGTHARTCNASCQWDDFGACAGPDPGDGGVGCETGRPGACGAGTKRCVDGAVTCAANEAARDEVCNGVDDDCDGVIDDGVCGAARDGGTWGTGGAALGAGGAGGVGGAGGAAALGDANGEVLGGCACHAGARRAGASDVLVALGLALAAIGRRVRRGGRPPRS